MTDSELMQLSEQVGQALKARGATVTTAESCTGGWVAKVITDGSVANYFKAHGWVKGDQVAVMANGQAPGLPNGFKTRYSISQLATAGLTPQQPLGNHQQASLLRLDVGTGYQYWYGLPNFYTITRYNHSTHYAMAVWQLGQAVALARVQ